MGFVTGPDVAGRGKVAADALNDSWRILAALVLPGPGQAMRIISPASVAARESVGGQGMSTIEGGSGRLTPSTGSTSRRPRLSREPTLRHALPNAVVRPADRGLQGQPRIDGAAGEGPYRADRRRYPTWILIRGVVHPVRQWPDRSLKTPRSDQSIPIAQDLALLLSASVQRYPGDMMVTNGSQRSGADRRSARGIQLPGPTAAHGVAANRVWC
jgi:hypothetical protein